MTLDTRRHEAAIKVIILIAALIICFSMEAQVKQAVDASGTRTVILNKSEAGKITIRMAANVNMDARPVRLHHSINSAYDDIKPRLSPSGNRLYFSRNFHPGNVNAVNDPEDIWYAEFDSASNTWTEPLHMTGVLNNAGPNYVNNVSTTGDTVILGNQYLKKGKMRAGLSYSTQVHGEWTTPTTINIDNDYNMSQHENSYVSLKDRIIIRTIERAESIGGRDLFVSFWNGDRGTEPLNMGAVINTEFEESSPFLAADNKTLYFASKGHGGYGGYDIYVTHRLDDSWTNWTTPQNLGPAVNGDLDDEFFSISQDGTYAVFSKQVSVHNIDIYGIAMEEVYRTAGRGGERVKG